MYPPSYEEFSQRDWDDETVEGTLSFALVGLGGFTREWVVPAIDGSEYAETTCVVSGDSEKAQEVAETADADVSLTYEEFENGVDSDAYDAVYIATPNATHLDLTEAAAEHEKHVLCEKPMEISADRSRQMVDRCEEEGVSLMIAYRIHFEPAMRWVRDLLSSGEIGDPVHVRGSMSQPIFEMIGPDPDQWRLNPELSGGAALIDLGIYPLNTTRFLLDADPVAADGRSRSPTDGFESVDEHVAFTVEFENGVLGSYTASQNAAISSHLHVTTTDGEIRIEPAFFGDVDVSITDGERRTTVTFEEANAIRAEFDYFASRVLNDRPLEPDGEHGLVDMEAIESIYESDDVLEPI
ncbi:D-xylose 1-dehydrogenase Gfo6 [Natrarchaeobius chitinivorans]|uniref:Gfo/Idh/MocA family oxidoreductase n=1 Tax=Natrarchaeobius chitinivorans TaxID=1679083 RepID=A0A3N6MLU5_NATCH|nr:D-xylose 1-dehydrogenase Gfo6 [Natrarchaeobius chitinivorans]RQG95366.1 gfo/Idh/MocA family oxidoreductase [Natrarchaeobius chitinivorans]